MKDQNFQLILKSINSFSEHVNFSKKEIGMLEEQQLQDLSAKLTQLHNVRSIDASDNIIWITTTPELKLLVKALVSAPSLEALNLSRNDLGELYMERLLAFFDPSAKCLTLKVLILSNNDFGFLTIQELQQFVTSLVELYPNLKTLNLDSNELDRFTGAHWNILCNSLIKKLLNLKLDLTGNAISDEGLRILLKTTSIEFLILDPAVEERAREISDANSVIKRNEVILFAQAQAQAQAPFISNNPAPSRKRPRNDEEFDLVNDQCSNKRMRPTIDEEDDAVNNSDCKRMQRCCFM